MLGFSKTKKLRGTFTFYAYAPNSYYKNAMPQIVSIRKKKNTVVNNGYRGLIDSLLGKGYQIRNIALGTGINATTAEQNDLETPALENGSPIRLAIPAGGRYRTDKLLTISMLIPSTRYDRPLAVTEMGVFFDPISTGNMFSRAVNAGIFATLGSGQAGRFDYEVQF